MKVLMLSYLFAVFFILALLSDFLPFSAIIKSILLLNKNSFQTISSADVADSEKQSILLANSANIFKQSAKLLGLILLLIAFSFLLFLLSGIFQPMGYKTLLNDLITMEGVVISVLAFVAYFLLKKLYVKVRL